MSHGRVCILSLMMKLLPHVLLVAALATPILHAAPAARHVHLERRAGFTMAGLGNQLVQGTIFALAAIGIGFGINHGLNSWKNKHDESKANQDLAKAKQELVLAEEKRDLVYVCNVTQPHSNLQ